MTDASNLVVMGTAMCSQICEVNLCLTVVNRHSVKWQIVRTTVCCLETAGDVRAQTWKMKCSSVMRIRVISLIFLNQPRISDLFIRESVAERGLQKFTWGFSKMKLFILLKLITIVAWFSNSRVLQRRDVYWLALADASQILLSASARSAVLDMFNISRDLYTSQLQWNFYNRFKSWWRELVTACNLLLTISVLLFVFVSGETFYWVRLKNPIRNVWHINIYFLISVYCWVDCACKVWLFTDDWENYFVDFISFYDNYFYHIYTR